MNPFWLGWSCTVGVAAATEPAAVLHVSAGLLAFLLWQMDYVQLQLQAKAAADEVVEKRLLVLQQQLEELVVPREELQKMLMEKLDISTFLASLATRRQKAAKGTTSAAASAGRGA
jgi:hypothetical protein